MLVLLDRYLALSLNAQYIQPRRLSKLYSFTSTCLQRYTATFLFALLAVCNTSAVADKSTLKLSTGAEYITGDFGGTEPVEQLYIPVTTRYTTKRYSFRLTVPYISLTAPTGTVQSDGTILPGTGPIVTESGMGDVIAGVTYRDAFNSEVASDVAIDFTAKVKFGTADVDKGLGSGENDYTIQTELYKFLDRIMLFGILGYKFRGDPPGVDLNNSLIAYLGGNYRLTPAFRTGVDFYYQEALFSGADDQVELSAFLGYKLSNTQYLRSYLIKGFGDASPDWGVGVYISFMQ
jgi:hypothetical protein